MSQITQNLASFQHLPNMTKKSQGILKDQKQNFTPAKNFKTTVALHRSAMIHFNNLQKWLHLRETHENMKGTASENSDKLNFVLDLPRRIKAVTHFYIYTNAQGHSPPPHHTRTRTRTRTHKEKVALDPVFNKDSVSGLQGPEFGLSACPITQRLEYLYVCISVHTHIHTKLEA